MYYEMFIQLIIIPTMSSFQVCVCMVRLLQINSLRALEYVFLFLPYH